MINDLGLGHCARCKQWQDLPRFHPRDILLARKDRRRVCTKCAGILKAELEPFHRVKKAISNHKVRCKEGDYTFTDLMRLHTAQGCKCAYCETPIQNDFSLEHVIPVKFGGRNLRINIILICETCNSSKQHFELVFWLEKNKYKLRERIFQRVKGAYDYHDYEFTGNCSHCRGEARSKTLASIDSPGGLCNSCPCRQTAS